MARKKTRRQREKAQSDNHDLPPASGGGELRAFLSDELGNPRGELRDLCDASFCEIADVLVFKPPELEEDICLAYRDPGPAGPDTYVDWRISLHYKVIRQVTAMCQPSQFALDSASFRQSAENVHAHRHDELRAKDMRTLRMLLLFEAIFTNQAGTFERTSGTWRVSFYSETRNLLQAKNNALLKVVNSVSRETISITENWAVSVPFLVLLAIQYSQGQLEAPICWEGFSAARAGHELQERWKGAIGNTQGSEVSNVLSQCIRFIQLIIRYQSAIGQYVRGSGDGRFLETVRDFAKANSAFSQKVILDVLRLMGVVEEVRNHQLPGTQKDSKIEDIRVNAGARRKWKSSGWFLLSSDDLSANEELIDNDDLQFVTNRVVRSEETLRESLNSCIPKEGGNEAHEAKVLALIEEARVTPERYVDLVTKVDFDGNPTIQRPKHTWSLITSLKLHDRNLEKFRKLVEEHDTIKNAPAEESIAAIAFDRGLVADIQPVLTKCVELVVHDPKAFDRYFDLRRVSVPSIQQIAGGDGHTEIAIEIKLRDEIAARALLFLNGDAREEAVLPPKQNGEHGSLVAADLLLGLFDAVKARGEFCLEDDALASVGEELAKLPECYVPFPLFDRMLTIVARLRRAECVSVSIGFDGELKRRVSFPAMMIKEEHKKLAGWIANHVHATVLNRAMTFGYGSCDVSFSSMIGSAPPENIEREIWKQHIDEWKRRIEDAYHANGYRTLADKYVSDFNRHRQTVEITEGLRLDFLKIPAIGVADVFDKWQSQEEESCRLLLGIGVGGTLVKF